MSYALYDLAARSRNARSGRLLGELHSGRCGVQLFFEIAQRAKRFRYIVQLRPAFLRPDGAGDAARRGACSKLCSPGQTASHDASSNNFDGATLAGVACCVRCSALTEPQRCAASS